MVTGYVIVNEKDDSVYTDESDWTPILGGGIVSITAKIHTSGDAADETRNEVWRQNYPTCELSDYSIVRVLQESPGGPFNLLW